jgi:hypothetical protein
MENAKVWDQASVQHLIATNDNALAKALWNLYQRQTTGERSAQTTLEHNGRGFNSRDAEFLSSVAAALPRWNFHMTPRQIAKVRPMMKKYWRQLLEEIELKGGRIARSTKREIAIERESEEAISCETAPAFNHEIVNPLFGAYAM